MSRGRMEAFSDGVLAIIITIMVLKLNAPKEITIEALKEIIPIFVSYVVSFIYVGIYWGNHHHLVSAISSVSGRIMWRNLHWLFWMSLLPFATEWTGMDPFADLPAFTYGFVLLMCAISYHMLQAAIIKQKGPESCLQKSIGNDFKGKVSIFCYALGTAMSFVHPLVAYGLYMAIAVLWFIPDTRLECYIHRQED